MADAKKLLGGLGKIRQRLTATPDDARLAELTSHSGDQALPLVLPRARMTPEFIDQQADRVARQMLGEHVRSGKPKDTTNLAGRSMKESQRLKNLNYKLTPTGTVAQETTYIPRKGDVKVAFPGDQTVSNKVLEEVEGFPIDSVQEGGAYYGLGQKHLPEPEFWKSTETPAKGVQGKIDRVAELFEPERVIGSHLAMGPTSNNFAMHFADANLRAVDWSKVQPKNVQVFDNIIAGGYKDPKTGEMVTFPNWPGLADREGALAAMKEDSNLRKWFNNRTKVPKITQPLGLPNGLDIQYAITEPRIRDMEINMTGLMTGELKPNALVEAAGNPHNTYSHRILGEAQGPQEVLTPFVIGFPDAAQHIATTKRPSDFTGTIQKVFPHQVVDDQYLDEYNRYRERIKKLTGQKKGGEVDIDEEDALIAKGIEERINNMGMAQGGGAFKKLEFMDKGGKVGKLAQGVANVGKRLLADAPVETKAEKQTRLNMMPTARIGVEAPGILIPSKMNNVREAVRNMKGNYGARRVERAADEIPNLEKMYQEDALKEAFTGDNASAMITLNPAEFERYALELKGRTKNDIGPKMAELARQGDIDKYTVPMDEYIQHLQRLQDGFSDLPYLNLFKDEVGLPVKPSVIGHEGRHRSRALSESGAPASLVKINPRGDLREGMPRRTQEDFIEALKEELELSNRLVLPEVDGSYRRPAVELPDVYADGGNVQSFDKGGKAGKVVSGLASIGKRLIADNSLPALEREANLQKFLAESKTPMRLYHGTTATEGGKGTEAIRRLKPSKEGALGSGVYMTPNPNYAEQYTYKGAGDYEGGNVLPVYAQIKNPLVIDGSASNDPMIEALIRLGMDESQASRMVERAYENKGYIGKEVESRARAAGYDGLMQYTKDGELGEVVSYNPNAVKSAIGNKGTYDIYSPELSKAEGGGAFKTLQFKEPQHFDGGGMAVDMSESSPLITKREWENIKRNAPAVYDWAKQNVKDEANQLKSARGAKDFALRVGAQYAGAIPDLVNLGLMLPDAVAGTNLASEKPWFGSQQIIDAMHSAGMLGENEFPISETVAGILAPAGLIKKGVKKGYQAYKGMKPEAPKKRRGGLAAMSR